MKRLLTTCLLTVALLVGLMPAGALADGNIYVDDFSGYTTGGLPSTNNWEMTFWKHATRPFTEIKVDGNCTGAEDNFGCKHFYIDWPQNYHHPSGNPLAGYRFVPASEADYADEPYELVARVWGGPIISQVYTEATDPLDDGTSVSMTTATHHQNFGTCGWDYSNSVPQGVWVGSTCPNNSQHLDAGGWHWIRLARDTHGNTFACSANDYAYNGIGPGHGQWGCQATNSSSLAGEVGTFKHTYQRNSAIDYFAFAWGDPCDPNAVCAPYSEPIDLH